MNHIIEGPALAWAWGTWWIWWKPGIFMSETDYSFTCVRQQSTSPTHPLHSEDEDKNCGRSGAFSFLDSWYLIYMYIIPLPISELTMVGQIFSIVGYDSINTWNVKSNDHMSTWNFSRARFQRKFIMLSLKLIDFTPNAPSHKSSYLPFTDTPLLSSCIKFSLHCVWWRIKSTC